MVVNLGLTGLLSVTFTLWKFNITMEHHDFSMEIRQFISKRISIATLDFQTLHPTKVDYS